MLNDITSSPKSKLDSVAFSTLAFVNNLKQIKLI